MASADNEQILRKKNKSCCKLGCVC